MFPGAPDTQEYTLYYYFFLFKGIRIFGFRVASLDAYRTLEGREENREAFGRKTIYPARLLMLLRLL